MNGCSLLKKRSGHSVHYYIKVWILHSLDKQHVEAVRVYLSNLLEQMPYSNLKFCPHKYILQTLQKQKQSDTIVEKVVKKPVTRTEDSWLPRTISQSLSEVLEDDPMRVMHRLNGQRDAMMPNKNFSAVGDARPSWKSVKNNGGRYNSNKQPAMQGTPWNESQTDDIDGYMHGYNLNADANHQGTLDVPAAPLAGIPENSNLSFAADPQYWLFDQPTKLGPDFDFMNMHHLAARLNPPVETPQRNAHMNALFADTQVQGPSFPRAPVPFHDKHRDASQQPIQTQLEELFGLSNELFQKLNNLGINPMPPQPPAGRQQLF